MSSSDTAAGRLHQILLALRQSAQNRQLRTAWGQALAISPTDQQALFVAVANVMSLPDEAERTIRDLPDQNHELLLRWRPAVDQAMSIAHQFEGATANFTAHYSEAHLFSLEHGADLVARYQTTTPELVADGAQVASAISLVHDLLETLATSNLEPFVKETLVRHATAMATALQLVRVTGPQGIRAAAIDAASALKLFTDEHPEKDTRAPIRRFLEVLSAVANTVTIAAGGLQLAAPVAALLLGTS
ncbi:hypothetical protein [Occultella kanbiaonis]|uniref:hypothetical protein n=1 Tax=Occultella kanbiaonis TaxID=2675754 RepID=UPI0013D11556|nr:hypothetical protein [Occultella kanbiaonis]